MNCLLWEVRLSLPHATPQLPIWNGVILVLSVYIIMNTQMMLRVEAWGILGILSPFCKLFFLFLLLFPSIEALSSPDCFSRPPPPFVLATVFLIQGHPLNSLLFHREAGPRRDTGLANSGLLYRRIWLWNSFENWDVCIFMFLFFLFR